LKEQKTAIILAAGRGSRLKELSLENPKPMTVVSDATIIENLIRSLIASNIQKIVVVIGYMAHKLQDHIEQKFKSEADFIFVKNEIFDRTNNIYSLWLAREYMRLGFYLFEADVYCDTSIVQQLVDCDHQDIMLIDKYLNKMDGTVVTLDSDGTITNMILKKDQKNQFDYNDKYKTINFYRISAKFVSDYFLSKLNEHIQGKDVGSYYEQIIKEAVDEGYKFKGLVPSDGKWWEIDTQQDLAHTRRIFYDNLSNN
jgi:choline kinase